MFAIAHFIATAVLMKLTKLRLDKTLFLSHRELLLCAVFGILPDVDMLLYLFVDNMSVHRAFTHNLFIPIVLLFTGLIILKLKGFNYAKMLFFAGAAYGVHLIVDLLSGSMLLLFPFSTNWIGTRISYGSAEVIGIIASIDTVLLLGWLALRYYKSNKLTNSL